MSKNVIHNFNIAIKNIPNVKRSEDLKEIFLKELAKISREMRQEKDIVQLWQQYQNDNASILSNISTKKNEITTLKKIKNPIVFDTTVPTLEKTKQDSNISKAVPESLFFATTDNSKIIDSLVDTNISSTNLNDGSTTQIYNSISTQQSLIIPSEIPITGNKAYSDIIKTEIKKKFDVILIENDLDSTIYKTPISKDFNNKKGQEHFAEQINIETKKEGENQYKISETSINNISWKKLSESLIFKLSELSKEEKNLYLKEYYDILIKKIIKPNINIQQLFGEHDELFILLKSVFPSLPEKITIQTERIIYPDLGVQKMYPEIGIDNVYFRASETSSDNIKYLFKLKEDYNTISPIDLIKNDTLDPLHHQFLITTALQIYDAAKSREATGKGALLIMALASIESGYGKDAIRRGDYNLFGTSTNGNDYKVKNTQIKIKDYSTVGGFDASIKDFFTDLFKKWPSIEKVIKNENFTSDDINKAFYTGIYIEDEKTRNKTGHGTYNFEDVETSMPNGRGTIISNNNKYGEGLMKQMANFQKRLVDSIDYQIKKNRIKIAEISKKKEPNDNNLNILIFIEPIKDFTDITTEILDSENKKLAKIKNDIEN